MNGVRAWVALGSNLGDRRATLEGAVAALRVADEVEVLRVSPWLETAPVGGPSGQGRYLNGCLEAETTLDARTFHWLLGRVETQFGRDRAREVVNGPRTLDLDLLLFGVEGSWRGASRVSSAGMVELDGPDLVLPHPRMEERLFVLEPLCTLAPELRLPRSGRTVRERVAELRAAAGGAG